MSGGPIRVTYEGGWASREHVELTLILRKTLQFATMEDAERYAETCAGGPLEWSTRVNPGGKVTVLSGEIPYQDGSIVFVANWRD
jgi:hypothetical protein